MDDWMHLLGGGLLLYFGAEWLVGGASALALALRVPQLLVGLTVVAFGTSAPEVVVGIQAAIGGHPGVALGNVVGSNIANVGLILGLSILVRPPTVDRALRRRELPVLIASTAVLPLVLLDGALVLWEALALTGAAMAYTVWAVRATRGATALAEAMADAASTARSADLAGAPHPVRVPRAVGTVVLGLALLIVGGSLFIAGAVTLAHDFGVSDRVVGLTLVAVGTSLPELVTSLVAARRGHADIVIGNVVGSNIFNVFLCLGTAGLAGTVGAPLASVGFDLAALALMTGAAVVLMRSPRTIIRPEGAVLLLAYVAYVALTLGRG